MGRPLPPANANRCHMRRLREDSGRIVRRRFDRQGRGKLMRLARKTT